MVIYHYTRNNYIAITYIVIRILSPLKNFWLFKSKLTELATLTNTYKRSRRLPFKTV